MPRRARVSSGSMAPLLSAALAAGALAHTSAGIETLSGRILERLQQDRDQLLKHRFVESALIEKLAQDGTVRSSTVEVYEVFTLDGERLKRPLSEDVADGPEGFTIVRQEESRFLRPRTGPGRPAGDSGGDGLDLERLVGCFNLYPVGREALEGDEVLRVAFSAKDGCMGRETRAARLLGHLAGTLWLDADRFDILRVQGHLKGPVTFGFGILGRVERFDLELDRERVESGFYATTRITYRARGSSFLLNRFDLRSSRHRSAFAPVLQEPLPRALLSPPGPEGAAAPR